MWNDEEKAIFIQILKEYGPDLADEQIDMLLQYSSKVVEENQKVNLTAITKPEEFAVKHIIDSLLVLDHVSAKSIVDVGTGAGMPGLIWAIVYRDCQYLLLDSLKKRVKFLGQTVSLLGLDNVKYLHSRAEEAAKASSIRESFDIATARAVASFQVLLEYCLPFVKIGGKFIALKGPDAKEEVTSSKKALAILGGEIEYIYDYQLPLDMGDRSLIVVKKVATTPKKYPRKPGTPTKSPL